LWRRIYLDYIFLGITLVTIVLQYLDFNPTTGFAASLYNFVAPFLAWIGLTLLLIRGLTKILQKLRNPLIKVYRLLFKDLSTIISKNIFYRLEKISKITILLSLTISFGLVVSVINATYEVGAQQDAAYQVGADIRVMFPNTGYLDYNTSDFIASLEGNFTQEIYDTTSLYKSGIQLGRSGLLLIGIEPETFFDVANIEDNYLYTESLEGTKMALLDNSSGLYNNIIFSETLTNPTYAQDSSRESRRGGLNEDADSSTQVFMIGESYPIQAEGAVSEITVADIAYHFPAIADVTGKSDDELIYAITNVEFLKSPVADSNVNLLADENAVLSLIKINEGYSSEEVIDNIYTWYAENYPSSSDISLISVEDKLEEYLPLMSSLTGLTTMEFILVLAVSSLGLEIFIVSSLYDRKKEFGTYYAIGASKRDVRGIVFGELLLITGFSLVSGLLLGGLISFMYLTFISSLLVLSVSSLVIPMVSVVILIVLVVLATLLAIGLSSGKLAKLDPVNILRTV
jgi:ABC-type antimicrobial peptide transport system permease subunit